MSKADFGNYGKRRQMQREIEELRRKLTLAEAMIHSLQVAMADPK